MPSHDSIPLLRVGGVDKRFGTRRVLDGVSFDLAPGELAVLTGPNGAGKSTLLRCLAGLASFTGDARVHDTPLDTTPAARRLVGYVPQSVSLPATGTVGEMLALFARLRGAGPRDLDLARGFIPPAYERLGVLSGGQRQRVVLATALLGRPPLLLLDEPDANLDEDGRDALWQVLRDRASDGASALIASPSASHLADLADRAIALRSGRITENGGPRPRAAAPPAVTSRQATEVGA